MPLETVNESEKSTNDDTRQTQRHVKRTLLAAVDKLASVDTLGGEESLLLQAEAVGVAEHDRGQRGTTARVVDDCETNGGMSCLFGFLCLSSLNRASQTSFNQNSLSRTTPLM